MTRGCIMSWVRSRSTEWDVRPGLMNGVSEDPREPSIWEDTESQLMKHSPPWAVLNLGFPISGSQFLLPNVRFLVIVV